MLYRDRGGSTAGGAPSRGLWADQRRQLRATRLGAETAAALDDDELIDRITAFENLAAWAAGGQLSAMAEFARRRRRRGSEREFAADEFAPAATLTPRTANARLDLAEDLADRLPAVLAAMSRGHISLAKAAIIASHTALLDEVTARAVADGILDDAMQWTTGQLGHRLAKAVLHADPSAADRRAAQAKQDRDVHFRADRDGNARMDAVLDAHDGAAAFAVIDDAARAAKTPSDERTIGERRAAAMTDLILGRQHSPSRTSDCPAESHGNAESDGGADSRGDVESHDEGVSAPGPVGPSGLARQTSGGGVTTIVNIVAPLSVIEWISQDGPAGHPGEHPGEQRISEPGWIEGLGAVPGATIRELIRELLDGRRAASSGQRIGWRIVGCEDGTGAPHAIGHTRYRRPQALQELVQLRDRTCRFPGCRRQAARCDTDHAVPWESGGPTCDCNLESLCRHHHRLKQRPGWTMSLEHDVATWTSPTGRTYTDHPPSDWLPGDCLGVA